MKEDAPVKRSVAELAGKFKNAASTPDAKQGATEDAPVKRSVAELAGKFKNAASTPDAEQGATSKPVRRRPPRSLQIPPHPSAEPERADGATSSFAARPKRNSALIEKLQANLALSPSPKSPGFMFIGPSFTLPSPSPSPSPTSGHNTSSLTLVAAATPVTPTSPLPLLSPQSEEEVPASFETPASTVEGAVLSSINKSRARLSIKRRPPSRRNRVSSSGEEEGAVSPNTEDTPLLAPSSEPGGEKPKGGGEGEGEGAASGKQEVFDPEASSDRVHGGPPSPPGPEDHMATGPACTQPGPPDGGAGGGGGGGGQSERKPDECLPMGEEEEGASRSRDGPEVSSAQMKDVEESRDHKADESQETSQSTGSL